MTIAVNDTLPAAEFKTMTDDGPAMMTSAELFDGKKVVLFAVPGAFTPTCHNNHLPGFVEMEEAITDKGVDTIAVVSVNDAFAMGAWKTSAAASSNIVFLSDWDASFTKAIGMDIDLSVATLGVRSKRYAMVVDNGVVQVLNVEESPGEAVASSAVKVLEAL